MLILRIEFNPNNQYKTQIVMKKISILLTTFFMITILSAQNGIVPRTDLKTLEGATISTDNIIEPGVVTILVFWKSCNKTCLASLDAMHEVWQDSLEEKGVRMLTVCVDGTGSWNHVRPYVDGNAWEFETYIDVNCDLKRAMNVNNVPCTILLDADQNLICRHDGFCTGSEAMLCDKVQKHLYASLD